MTGEASTRRGTYAGLFMVTLATLMYEILLTRIFSVTMLYHFAFVAISVAMFGMTTSAILVYLLPKLFTAERVRSSLALSALLFAIAIVFSFLTHLSIPYARDTVFEKLASGQDTRAFIAHFPYNITAPTDDSPFFFQVLRFRDMLKPAAWGAR